MDPANPRQQTYLMDLVARPEAVMVRGEGSYLWDDAGRRYLDFVQGWAVNALGHAPKEISTVLARQGATLLNVSPAYHNAPATELAGAISALTGLERVFFCNSGAEANEGAIKLVRKWGKRHKKGAFEIVTTVNGFHGRTLATMAASGKPGWDTMFPPKIDGFVKVPFGDADAVASAIGPGTAAILVEPIQGEGGVVVPPDGYLRQLRALADQHGVLLVFDEVQTGVGRTGEFVACAHEGVRPDLLTLGKGLGGGVPLAALVASEGAAVFERGEQGGTFNGNPLMTSVGLAVVRAVGDPEFLARVRSLSATLRAGLQRLAPAGVAEVRGKGLLVAARLESPRAEAVRDAAFQGGLLVNAVRPDTLRFMPALNVKADEIAEMLDVLGRAMAEAR